MSSVHDDLGESRPARLPWGQPGWRVPGGGSRVARRNVANQQGSLTGDNRLTARPLALQRFDLEMYRMRKMARLWVEDNGVSPYKLALSAGVSTSQTHKLLTDRWSPTPKLLTRIVRALPIDWIAEIERDLDFALPSCERLLAPMATAETGADCQADLLRARTEADVRRAVESHQLNLHVVDFRSSEPVVTEAIVRQPWMRELLAQNRLAAPTLVPNVVPAEIIGEPILELCRLPLRQQPTCVSLAYLAMRLRIGDRLMCAWSVENVLAFQNARQHLILERFRARYP